MFSHIMLGTNDVQKSKKFYNAILGALGHEPGTIDEKGRCFWVTKTGIFGVTKPLDGKPAGNGNGSTFGFAAASPAAVNAWHAAGIANGGTTCEDPPGIREGRTGQLYLAYLRDPDGNKLCALHRVKN